MREGYGVCPVCNGAKLVPLTDKEKSYTWNKDNTHRECRNCGGQTMYGSATGEARLRKDGTPCTHSYNSRTIGRCLTLYTCQHCDSSYEIDSGD